MAGVPRGTVRKLHRLIGLVLLLPLFGWAATGAVFFIKPGYAGAYETLAVKTYPLEAPIAIRPDPAWREARYLRTILGSHLIVRGSAGWSQLDPATLRPLDAPTDDAVMRLIADAITADPARYGHVARLAGNRATTDTGVMIRFDWNSLALQQHGGDTDRIDRLYKIHYLQWTGNEAADRILGMLGLALLALLTVLGVRLAFLGA